MPGGSYISLCWPLVLRKRAGWPEQSVPFWSAMGRPSQWQAVQSLRETQRGWGSEQRRLEGCMMRVLLCGLPEMSNVPADCIPGSAGHHLTTPLLSLCVCVCVLPAACLWRGGFAVCPVSSSEMWEEHGLLSVSPQRAESDHSYGGRRRRSTAVLVSSVHFYSLLFS